MKKFLISFSLAIIGLSVCAQEKGDMAVGLNLGVAPSLESGVSVTNFGIGAKFQYNVTNPIRLEADIDYWFKSKGMDVFDISVNAHYLFHFANKITVYPLIGLGYAHGSGIGQGDPNFEGIDTPWGGISKDEYNDSFKGGTNSFLFNVGAGAEYTLTNKLSVGVEIKYQYIDHFNRLPITIGATYKF